MVCCGLPVGRGVGHHARSIHLGDLDFSTALSLESHRHLHISIIDSIVGEVPTVLLTFFVRDPFLRYIPHRPLAYPAETTTVVKRFQFRPVFFFQSSPAFAPPECYVDNNRLIEPATHVHRNPFVTEHLPVRGVE
jgi:hypothetical protein